MRKYFATFKFNLSQTAMIQGSTPKHGSERLFFFALTTFKINLWLLSTQFHVCYFFLEFNGSSWFNGHDDGDDLGHTGHRGPGQGTTKQLASQAYVQFYSIHKSKEEV